MAGGVWRHGFHPEVRATQSLRHSSAGHCQRAQLSCSEAVPGSPPPPSSHSSPGLLQLHLERLVGRELTCSRALLICLDQGGNHTVRTIPWNPGADEAPQGWPCLKAAHRHPWNVTTRISRDRTKGASAPAATLQNSKPLNRRKTTSSNRRLVEPVKSKETFLRTDVGTGTATQMDKGKFLSDCRVFLILKISNFFGELL